jgi:hypothetical protein
MKKMPACYLVAFFTVLVSASGSAQAVIPSEVQVKMALLAAPAEKRDGATVMGYDAAGKLVVLRKGTNEMICLADDPKQKGLSVSCYHKDLEPFMQRGRELKAEGKSQPDIIKIRDEEARAGKVKLVTQPSTLFAFSAKDEDCDFVKGEVKNGYLRYVVYIPYATAESTGLPLKQDMPGMPWIMDPGTPRAHIMINPPQQKQ